MQSCDNAIRLSATDLSRHLACKHLTEISKAKLRGALKDEPWRDPAVEHRQLQGLAHERAYVDFLRARGRGVVDLRDGESDLAARTIESMRQGAEVIVQARLEGGRWAGWADLLERVERPSALGGWSYEVADTKLAQGTTAGTVLQLCLYTDLLKEIQGAQPERMHVVKPGDPFERESFRYADFAAYFRLIRRRLEGVVNGPTEELYRATYPEPCAHCDVCDWWKLCGDKRRSDDHLSLVAGMGAAQADEFVRQGRRTLTELADAARALDERPATGSRETYDRLQGQARVQLERRRTGELVAELLPYDHDDDRLRGRGLALLPEPDAGDVYFDIEGDHYFEGGGLEYMFGVAFREGDELRYRRFLATDREEERGAYEQLIDFLSERLDAYPGMHVYHFAPYEPATLKRLEERHGTRESALDRLLRSERFVDLHAATRQGLRVAVERYSLKDLEAFCGYSREVDLREASAGRREIGWALERHDPGAIDPELWLLVEGYNREDCEATEALHRWLEQKRAELVAGGVEIPRPTASDSEPSEQVEERQARIDRVAESLRQGLGEDRGAWTEEERARALLAEVLSYYRREDRVAYWEKFRLLGLDPEGRLDERKAIEGLEFVEDLGPATPRGRVPVHRFRFPSQEIAMGPGDELIDLDGDKVGTVERIDRGACLVDVKRVGKTVGKSLGAVLAFSMVSSRVLEDSLLALGEALAASGIDGEGPYRAAQMLLLKRAPRLAQAGSLREQGESALEAARRAALVLDRSVLAVQGPPGTGKTYTGARVIADLVRAGKRVGVTAVSHAVIQNLVTEALAASRTDGGRPIEAVIKTDADLGQVPGLETTNSNPDALAALGAGKLVGGTSWLWASDAAAEAGVDVLFVDEAGQLSLANTLSAARCAESLILLGDPQQLQQPQQAAHPEGAEIAALEHYLDGHATMPPGKGLFLETTYRMHPAICSFVSELYYEGRLEPADGCDAQALIGSTPFTRSGLHFVPCEHSANQSCAPEEVERVAQIVSGLLEGDVSWRNSDGEVAPLKPGDVLVVAPFNAQVTALTNRLHIIDPGIAVGTVDRFQGQQAPVLIYSMTSSSVQDAPRGPGFLFDPHRLNVAISRAKCVCIVVASPRLAEADPTHPEQMRWINGFCRLLESSG